MRNFIIMKKLRIFFDLIRLKNLLLAAFIQIVICYFMIPVSIIKNDFLLIFCSFLVVASGNLINDYFDIDIDKINKPQKILFTQLFNKSTLLIIYISFNLFALLLSILFLNKWYLFFGGMTLILWLYSSFLKKQLLLGNITIAFLGGVFLLFLGYFYQEFNSKLYFFSFFSFLMTLIREIVKDVEDIKGDELGNCQTFPVVFGIQKSKQLILTFLVILEFCIILFFYWYSFSIWSILWGIAIFSLIGYLIFKITRANKEKDFIEISSFCKKIMLIGTFGIIFT